MLLRVPDIPLLTEEEMRVRYEIHERIIQQTGNFRWLRDGHLDPRTWSLTAAHPLNQPDSRVVHLSDDGTVNLFVSEYKRVMMNDATLYYGSYKAWLVPIANFPLFDPTKCYRFVSRFI